MLVDAAQTAGHRPINVSDLPLDLLACPGHKGLLGPLGTGLLYLRPGTEQHVASFRQGGTGSASEDDRQPDQLPGKYESGNHNVPGLFGLEAALNWVQEKQVATIQQHEQLLRRALLDQLSGVSNVTLFGDEVADEQAVGVVSLTMEGFDPQDLAAILDADFDIQTRAGLHCAPGAHRSLGTLETGGTLRISVGASTTLLEVRHFVESLRQIGGA